jgi:bifunctional UDP-N-acetylglucosamine pyrophosphorylase/glucosamine-1-phosphate N-acetyltransferase
MVNESKKALVCLILAAGQGTRMKSETPKVLHKICGIPMIELIVHTARELGPQEICLVVGYREDLIRKHFDRSLSFVTQREQLGTGHAVLQAQDFLDGYDGDVIVLYGDVPLVTVDTLRALAEKHRKTRAAATLVTTRVANPHGFGRIVRNKAGKISKIIEEKDATPAQSRIREINPGIYCFKSSALVDALAKVRPANKQGEYYLTDVIEILAKTRKRIENIKTSDEDEIMQVNTRSHLARVNKIMRDRLMEELMEEGVTLIDPSSTFISKTVRIEKDVTIYPFSYIEGYTRIGEGSVIGPQAYITDTEIGRNCVVVMSYLSSCVVRNNSRIGPYTHLRPEAVIGDNVSIGNFVEVKKSFIDDSSKINHLSYIGDAKIGKNVNIGAGTITANYDGATKSETIIEDGASIGSGTVLIAPVRVGRKAVLGAGTIVPRRHDIPPETVYVGVPARELKPAKQEEAKSQ